ncbi:beta-galactosidase [Sphingomonas sp. RHCKR7]|nr:beta-galactosidase [Sphingomonas folli]
MPLKHIAALALVSALVAPAGVAHAQREAASPAAVRTPELDRRLFVGACYQPIDRSPAQIAADIAVMKRAGFNMVRMGDLSWDSFEPAEGQYRLEWFDRVLDQMHAAGIKVILDVPGLPAPGWLHQRYPGVDIISQDGARRHAATRYWDDLSDPDYRRRVTALAEAMLTRWGKHPAVVAVGYDNEVGSSPMSYSPGVKQRFTAWLKQRYGTIEALNAAWATQRWSRRIADWDSIDLPYGEGPGPNERNLDLHRFWSEQTIAALSEIDAVRARVAPQLPAISNLWPEAGDKGFDYLRSWERYATFGALGFYPGDPLGAAFQVMMMRAGSPRPVWFNEFTAGGGGDYGTPGRSRMWAYFGLLTYAQTFLAWTFNSHLGGEEQSLFGLLDHDDRPSWKVDEFARVATEFRKVQTLGFPRQDTPPVAIGYSFQTNWLLTPPPGPNTMKQYFVGNYQEQAKAAFQPLFEDNIDAAVIDVAHDPIDRYKLVVLPSAYVMDAPTADAVRRYVERGGTVVMTGYSAKADVTGQWFGTPLPGRLSDVFGLRTNAFYRAAAPLRVAFAGQELTGTDPYYEVLEPGSARVLARFSGVPGDPAAITVNRFGKGRAIYLATAPQATLLGPLLRSLYAELGIARGPVTPPGVVARAVGGRTLYVNTRDEPTTVSLPRAGRDLLTGETVSGTHTLPGYAVALVE